MPTGTNMDGSKLFHRRSWMLLGFEWVHPANFWLNLWGFDGFDFSSKPCPCQVEEAVRQAAALGFGVPGEFPVCHPETSKETGDLSGTSPLNRQAGTWGHPEKPVSYSDLTMRSQKGWFVKDSWWVLYGIIPKHMSDWRIILSLHRVFCFPVWLLGFCVFSGFCGFCFVSFLASWLFWLLLFLASCSFGFCGFLTVCCMLQQSYRQRVRHQLEKIKRT